VGDQQAVLAEVALGPGPTHQEAPI
jgi:hypothetical protein